MSSIPTIESHNLSIARLFQDFYVVPSFQREYVWQRKNVQKLLEDIFEGLGLYQGEVTSEYFIGSVVVYPNSVSDENTFYLIDGQQRLTTIYLIFCAIRNFIDTMGPASRSIENFLTGVAQDLKTGEDIPKYRLSLQYDTQGQEWIKSIVDRKMIEDETSMSSQSLENLREAWDTINDFLNNYVEKDFKEFTRISGAISSRVKIIRIDTPDLRNALKVFETINDRGVGLTPVDLLKNYLFMHSKESRKRNSQWSKLTQKWERLLKTLYGSKQKPLQFLRYYLLSHHKVDFSSSFPEDEIYDWFLQKKEEHGIQNDPIKFLCELVDAAESYCAFTKSKNVDGSENHYLKNISKIQGRARQHLILLMAGRNLETDLFSDLSQYIENLFFINAITRKTRRKDVNLTREFYGFSRTLKQVKNKDELDDFLLDYIFPEIEALKEDFKEALLQTSLKNLAKYRLKYMLAKINQYIEKEAYGTEIPLSSYLDKSVTIEHILPQSHDDKYCEKLGNLTLLEKTINSSIQDKDFVDKLKGYSESRIILARSLASVPNVGQNTSINNTMKALKLTSFNTWNHQSIDERQTMLVDIAMKVWCLEN